jgi:hypothetical protein
MSAFSIITALLFNYDQTKYTTMANRNPDLSSSSQDFSNLLSSPSSNADNDILVSFIQNYYESSFITAESKPKITFEKKTDNNI